MRLTFKWLVAFAEKNGFTVERDGRKYEVFSNKHAPGVIADAGSVEEAYGELCDLISQARERVKS